MGTANTTRQGGGMVACVGWYGEYVVPAPVLPAAGEGGGAAGEAGGAGGRADPRAPPGRAGGRPPLVGGATEPDSRSGVLADLAISYLRSRGSLTARQAVMSNSSSSPRSGERTV